MEVTGTWELHTVPHQWNTADGWVGVAPADDGDGWTIFAHSPSIHTMLAASGISVQQQLHARTRADAVNIAHAITGCNTALKRYPFRYRLVDHGLAMLDSCDIYIARLPPSRDHWYIWVEGGNIGSRLNSYLDTFSIQHFATRATALEAFYGWVAAYRPPLLTSV